MKRIVSLSLLTASLSLGACTQADMAPMTPYPKASPSAAPGSLADLLTGTVVNEAEQQLRDTLQRQIVLDFPIRLGVLFYQYSSQLDHSDREAAFKALQNHLNQADLISETVQLPDSLIRGGSSLESLRNLGARFQTDVLVLVTGAHRFERSRKQNLSFFDSFSDNAYYESEVQIEALALDIFTGTFLTPFSVAVKGESVLLDRAASDYAEQIYSYQKQVELQAWQHLQQEALERLQVLKRNVEARLSASRPQSPAPAEASASGESTR